MRPVHQLRLALEAEGLRLRHHARRTAGRVVFGCFALSLLMGALVFLHIAAWYWLRETMAAQFVALIFAGFDLLIALVLGALAARSSPGRVELEALEVRRRALDDAAASMTASAVLLRVFDAVMSSRRGK